MTATWRGVMLVGVLAVVQPGGAAAAVPALGTPDAMQPVPTPALPPVPPAAPSPRPRPERRVHRETPGPEGPWKDDDAPIVRSFKGGDGITLDLMNAYGDVVVVGGKGREGKLSIQRRVQGGGPEGDRLLRDLAVEVTEHANRVAVRTVLPRGSEGRPQRHHVRVRTDYEIALPAGTALELKNMRGNVRVTNVPGDVRVEAYAGDVVAEALTHVRMLRSMSGDVMLSRSTVEGDVNLQTVSGNVIAQAVNAGSLTLGSVSGNVQVKESSSARAVLRTVSGDIEFAGTPRKSGRYELKTHAGDIFVLAPGGQGFEFEASTFRGDVRADVPTQPVGSNARQVRGSVGEGSAFFDLSSFTGDIRVGRKP